MKVDHFDPPGNIQDFAGDANLAQKWTAWMSNYFDTGVTSVQSYLSGHGGGTSQFYNPLTHGSTAPDLPLSLGDIPWNGFPKRFESTGPGHPTDYASAEGPVAVGDERPQDEYLEWFANKKNGKIVSVHFTCEAYDYFQFLGQFAPAKVLALYQQWISPDVKQADLFPDGSTYNVSNKWNTANGAMHLTNGANNLFAEVFLAASGTIRRQQHGAEITQAIPLIKCSNYGVANRNSDPAIGAAVNGLARAGHRIALANPVGLYMSAFNGAGLTLNGNPAGGFFKVVRGALPMGLRAIYELPPDLAAQGLTVSDVKIGGVPIQFGGQLAQRITMHLVGVASVAQDLNNTPVSVCEPQGIPQVNPPGAHAMAAVATAASPSGLRKTRA